MPYPVQAQVLGRDALDDPDDLVGSPSMASIKVWREAGETFRSTFRTHYPRSGDMLDRHAFVPQLDRDLIPLIEVFPRWHEVPAQSKEHIITELMLSSPSRAIFTAARYGAPAEVVSRLQRGARIVIS